MDENTYTPIITCINEIVKGKEAISEENAEIILMVMQDME